MNIFTSVTDKRGLEKWKVLTDGSSDCHFISTGGTAKALAAIGIPCQLVETLTGFPEILGGRVKTLHPNIFGGILADRSKVEHGHELEMLGIQPIDVVVVNLYDFRSKPSVENIDIGGVALLRAAAKNYESVVAVSDPNDYGKVIAYLREGLENDVFPVELRRALAKKVFMHTTAYDADIAAWL